ncbi:MAG: hypothetical protein EBE86_028815 [Hormoscilla sp. GUM202]|nr:hypothetical protein [Hormoscilla sp. GUM202]
MTDLIAQIASDEIIDQAYEWLCRTRSHYHDNGDVWHLRRWWLEEKPRLQQLLRAGQYCFRELRLITGRERTVQWWHSRDALVLKAMTLVLTAHLKPHLSDRCFHLAGTGGLKGAVREVDRRVGDYDFVFRTDVKGYYASINHQILLRQLSEYVDDEAVMELLRQYLRRMVDDGGWVRHIQQGSPSDVPYHP